MANSQVQQLKQSLTAFSRSTDQTANGLASQAKSFGRSSQQVLSLIGGSATGKDREVAQAIQQAKDAVDKAARALNEASRTAKQYAGQI